MVMSYLTAHRALGLSLARTPCHLSKKGFADVAENTPALTRYVSPPGTPQITNFASPLSVRFGLRLRFCTLVTEKYIKNIW